jgi:hypothetical protein
MTISLGDTTIEDKPDKGCAQGVVLSPLLWCVMVNDLLEDLQPLSSIKKLQAMSKHKLKVAVGLLTGHTTPRAHMFKNRTCTEAGLPIVQG